MQNLNLLYLIFYSIKKNTDLFNNHSSKISKYLIKVRDGLNDLSNFSLSLFYYHCVLLNQN